MSPSGLETRYYSRYHKRKLERRKKENCLWLNDIYSILTKKIKSEVLIILNHIMLFCTISIAHEIQSFSGLFFDAFNS